MSRASVPNPPHQPASLFLSLPASSPPPCHPPTLKAEADSAPLALRGKLSSPVQLPHSPPERGESQVEGGAFKNQSCSTPYTAASPQLGIPSFLPKEGNEVNSTCICKPSAGNSSGTKVGQTGFFALENFQKLKHTNPQLEHKVEGA